MEVYKLLNFESLEKFDLSKSDINSWSTWKFTTTFICQEIAIKLQNTSIQLLN